VAIKERVFIGIPCYGSAPAPTLEDFMRMTYYFGRRYPEYDFFLGIIDKSEQFRARNRIVEAAISIDAKYLLMLDDDMVVDIDNGTAPSDRYEFLRKLIGHLEADEKIGVCGALYFQRGGEYHAVAMYKERDRYFWMRDEQIQFGLQQVDVAGGGCLLIRMSIFDRIKSPWFEPEMQTDGPSRGTDVQICEKAVEAGFKVMIDSSIELGHVSSRREVVTAANRHKARKQGAEIVEKAQEDWYLTNMMSVYNSDIEDYLKKDKQTILEIAEQYEALNFWRFKNYRGAEAEYYKTLGESQLCRQYMWHNTPGNGATVFLNPLLRAFGDRKLQGLDFGCGSAPLGFELMVHGQKMDFVDIDGAPAYEFLKWRCKKRAMPHAGFTLRDKYDFILMMDSIEHIPNWKEVLTDLCGRLEYGGLLCTNYFYNHDYDNAEHISMDKEAVRAHLLSLDMYPQAPEAWVKGANFTEKKDAPGK
jgi:hypothetical protein